MQENWKSWKMPEKIHLIDGHTHANYFSKTYIVGYWKMPKTKNFHRFISWQNSFKFEKCHKKSNIFHPVPATSTAGPCPTSK